MISLAIPIYEGFIGGFQLGIDLSFHYQLVRSLIMPQQDVYFGDPVLAFSLFPYQVNRFFLIRLGPEQL